MERMSGLSVLEDSRIHGKPPYCYERFERRGEKVYPYNNANIGSKRREPNHRWGQPSHRGGIRKRGHKPDFRKARIA
jgi:hypothetical protein